MKGYAIFEHKANDEETAIEFYEIVSEGAEELIEEKVKILNDSIKKSRKPDRVDEYYYRKINIEVI